MQVFKRNPVAILIGMFVFLIMLAGTSNLAQTNRGSVSVTTKGIRCTVYLDNRRYSFWIENKTQKPIQLNYFADEYGYVTHGGTTYKLTTSIRNYPSGKFSTINPGEVSLTIHTEGPFHDYSYHPMESIEYFYVRLGLSRMEIKIPGPRAKPSAPSVKEKTLEHYRLLAEEGDAEAQFYLGVRYQDGEVVPQDYKEAQKWLTMAAEQGYALAQVMIGVMYFKGEGVLQDFIRAHMWFNLAAAEGEEGAGKARDSIVKLLTAAQLAEAQQLARDWTETKTSAVSTKPSAPSVKEKTLEHYRLLAEEGDAEAQHKLGAIYYHGNEVIRDYSLAYMWFYIAANNGNKDGEAAIDHLTKLMTPEQIAEAQRLAKEWMDKHQKE